MEKNMLTEVDIERIMAGTRQLAEAVADGGDYETDCDFADGSELIELFEQDSPVSETNGLM
jgi:hypothetical protein